MAYLQFSLLHIPAVIVHGNSLSLEEYGHWYTPAHIMDGWNWKLRRAKATEQAYAIERVPDPAPEGEPPAEPARREPPSQLTLF